MEDFNEDMFVFRKGTKYYRIDNNDNVSIIRIVNIKNSSTFVCMMDEDYTKGSDINPSKHSEKLFTLSADELKNDYRLLLPHAQLCLTNVTTTDGIQDVLIAITKIEATTSLPSASSVNFGGVHIICRQAIADVFAMITHPDKTVYGLCISRDTCPSNINFDTLYANCIPNKRGGQFINFYQQDNIDQILGLLKKGPSDAILADNYKKIKSFDPTVEGLADSLEVLVKSNGLIFDIFKMFGIVPINNVTIKYDGNKYILNDDELDRLEYVIKCRMTDVLIVELNHFVSEEGLSEDYAHFKICDSSGKIYLIQYTPVSGFTEELYPPEVRDGMVNLLNKYQG